MKTQTNIDNFMAKLAKIWIGLVLVAGLSLVVSAANATPLPRKGKAVVSETLTPGFYWTIEVNKQGNPCSFVRFYNANNELVYEEYMKDKKLNIDRKAVRRKLNRLLTGFTSQQLYQRTF